MKNRIQSHFWPSVVFSLILLLAGCGLFGDDGPKEAELTITGISGQEVQLTVSNNFISSREPILDPISGFVLRDTVIVTMLTSETTQIELPYIQTYDISDNQQFYALITRALPGEDGLAATLRIDGEVRSDQRPGVTDSLVTIIYNFGNRIPEDTDVKV